MPKYLYTYVPKNNTVATDGLLSTALARKGWEKYIQRSGKTNKKDVLEWLDLLSPGFSRSNAVTVMSEPIPSHAHKDMQEFMESKDLYRLPPYAELKKLGLVKAIRAINVGGKGTHEVSDIGNKKIVWDNKKPGKFLFSNVPHYLVETADGRIPAEHLTKITSVHDVKVPENLIRLAKKYYDAEGSHGWNHIQDVLGRAKLMVNLDNRQLSDPEIAAVLFHDSSLRGGDRKTHHIDSSKIAEKELSALFDQRTLKRISKAIQQHRGSYKGKYYSKLSELVSSADRGAPRLEDIIKRSYLYQTEHGYADPEKLVVEHIKDKYSRYGYARRPEYYRRLYKDRLDAMYDRIDRITPEEVLSVVGK